MSLVTNPEVVVIGAGAAGLAAGRRLLAAGRKVQILEAAGHIGGRCVTDRDSLGEPFDRGGSWLHCATINPLTPLAHAEGFSIVEDQHRPRHVMRAGRRLTPAERDDYIAANNRGHAAIAAAGASGRDVSAEEVLPEGEYRAQTGRVLSWIHGLDPDGISTLDSARFVEAEGEWLLREGLGSLIARLGEGLPVALDTAVRAIDWSGRSVTCRTDRGDLSAEAAIVTVSSGLLAAGRIAFRPALPDWKTTASEDLPMGLLNKVALRFDGGIPGLEDDLRASYFPSDDIGLGLRINYLGSPLTLAFLGGRHAKAMEKAGFEASCALVREALTALFGSECVPQPSHSAWTDWWQNPLTLGAYSGARPGRADARAALARPLDERLFFAGEATIADWHATVAGAHLSGIRAAEEFLACRAAA